MKSRNITPRKQKFNIKDTKKCGAKTRAKTSCKSPAMKNGRCRMHGGKSTGARTQTGIQKIKETNFKHGLYTKENLEFKRDAADFLKMSKRLLNDLR